MEKDVAQFKFLSDNERYADLINGAVFGGRQVVRGTDLQEMDSQTGFWKTLSGRRKRKAGKKYRDLIRKVAMGVNFTIIGVENQDKVNYLMPLRTMLYDVTAYEKQAADIRKNVRKDTGVTEEEFLSGFKRSDRLFPCVTLVVFYGKEWDGSKDLHGILDFTGIPPELKELVSNYPIHLLEVRKIQNTGVFMSDLKQVFDFIRMSEDKTGLKKLVQGDAAFQNMDESAYDMAMAYTDASELISVKKYHRKDGKIDMCKALIEWMNDEREEGRMLGIRGMILDNLDQGKSQEEILAKLHKYYGLDDGQAEDCLEKVRKEM